MEIIAVGSPGVYVPFGRYTFRVKNVQLVGEGALRRAFELTKRKLAAEGLFDEQFKKQPLRIPETIGLITSEDAAAYTDVLRILKNRWSQLTIYFYHVQVQGERSPLQITEVLDWFNRYQPVDVIILTRGGGSLEDLQSFNSEAVCRAVFASRIPVISAVGHERDVTLVDFVADVRASTPSNAAEIAVPDRREVLEHVRVLERDMLVFLQKHTEEAKQQARHILNRLRFAMNQRLVYFQELSHRIAVSVRILARRLEFFQTSLADWRKRSVRAFQGKYEVVQEHVHTLNKHLEYLHPKFPLRRGFSITRTSAGKVIRSAREVRISQEIMTEFQHGAVQSRVRKIFKNGHVGHQKE